jgi:hypothetical protein
MYMLLGKAAGSIRSHFEAFGGQAKISIRLPISDTVRLLGERSSAAGSDYALIAKKGKIRRSKLPFRGKYMMQGIDSKARQSNNSLGHGTQVQRRESCSLAPSHLDINRIFKGCGLHEA